MRLVPGQPRFRPAEELAVEFTSYCRLCQTVLEGPAGTKQRPEPRRKES